MLLFLHLNFYFIWIPEVQTGEMDICESLVTLKWRMMSFLVLGIEPLIYNCYRSLWAVHHVFIYVYVTDCKLRVKLNELMYFWFPLQFTCLFTISKPLSLLYFFVFAEIVAFIYFLFGQICFGHTAELLNIHLLHL